MINDFHGEYYFLSNFSKSPVYWDGELYPTVEHAFQAAKMDSADFRKQIREAKGPNDAKRIGRRGPMRADWEEIKVDVMRQCLMRKFLLNPSLRQQLQSTGNEKLVEGNTWHDNCWGDCSCPKCASKTGSNHLGKLLMEIRDNDKKGLYYFAAATYGIDGSQRIEMTSRSVAEILRYLSHAKNEDGSMCHMDDKHVLILKD